MKRYQSTKFNVVREGYPFIFGFAGVGVLLFLSGYWFLQVVGAVALGLSVFSMIFFRDPKRNVPMGDGLIISPADGLVMEVCEQDCPFSGGKTQVVKIFLSVVNVHLQRSPCAGSVQQVVYKKGKFLDARDPRASFENENNSIVLQTVHGTVVVQQIAGLIARRIISWVDAGDAVAAGEHIGLIRFGSQVDLYLPMHLKVRAKKGDVVTGGETILAEV